MLNISSNGAATDSSGHEYRADDSRNNTFVAIVTGGEGNHSWHHADPACPRHGRKVILNPQAIAAEQLVPNQPLLQTHREWHIQEPPEIHDLLAA